MGGITGRGRRSRSFVSRCAKLASAQPAVCIELTLFKKMCRVPCSRQVPYGRNPHRSPRSDLARGHRAGGRRRTVATPVFRRTLEAEGFHVEEAQDGESALKLIQARAEPFDLVLTDLSMPQIDGRQSRKR